MFSRIVCSCAFCASAAWLPIATAGFLTFDNGAVDLRFDGTFGPEGGWTIIDGKLTNIGVDGVTRPLIVTEGYFWHENPDDGPGYFPIPNLIFSMRLVLESPNDFITIRGNNENCDLFSNCVPTPTVEFSVGGGHVDLNFHRVELIPQLRDDGSYAQFGIDGMDMTSPEPASVALLAIGAACAAVTRRFRALNRNASSVGNCG